MGYTLGLVTDGLLSGCRKTLPLVTIGYLNNCVVVDVPDFTPGGGAPSSAGRRTLTLRERQKLQDEAYMKKYKEFLLRDDEEILIVIKAFLKCQE